MRELCWREEDVVSVAENLSGVKYSILKTSLKDICSFDDLKQRMRVYLTLENCKQVFDAMTQVTKNIDEGRLKMKAHCPMVTDVGMKEKAVQILMSYNPIWLRIGLYIILGGDSLLSDGDVNFDQERAFLKLVIEKQFLTHSGLAKDYAYNKKVEGLYRPGYYGALGSVILKRMLMLVLILDRMKSQSSLPIEYGLDGLDGGSPLLFKLKSTVKSSRKMINDFLSTDVMHGEGNLLAHLEIVGYRVSYQQSPLVEFDFKVSDLFKDLQDGVRLSRAIQLLKHDPSILLRMTVPSDNYKKNLSNCGVVLQYLRQAGVTPCDEDGITVNGDDIVNGDKELTISLLWSMFTHLQLPLLIDKAILVEEISRARELDTDDLKIITSDPLDVLLNWVQAICEKYDLKFDSFSSLTNGKAIWCLLDHYFRKELSCSWPSNMDSLKTKGVESITSGTNYTDPVHNFVLSQKLPTLLGNIPEVFDRNMLKKCLELWNVHSISLVAFRNLHICDHFHEMKVLQISDLLEHNGAVSEKSVVILLVFLSSQLIVKKNVDRLDFHKLLGCNCLNLEKKHSRSRWQSSVEPVKYGNMNADVFEDASKKFRAIQAWWRDMVDRNYKFSINSTVTVQKFPTSIQRVDIQGDNAAIVIQSHFRRIKHRRSFLGVKSAIFLLQTVTRTWLSVKNSSVNKFNLIRVHDNHCEIFSRHIKLIIDRHHFLNIRRSVLLIQKAARTLISRRLDAYCPVMVNASITIQKYIRGWIARTAHSMVQTPAVLVSCKQKGPNYITINAAIKIQLAWKNFICRSHQKRAIAATTIQSNFRCLLLRRRFLNQKKAVITIQSKFRCGSCSRAFLQYRDLTRSAIIIQSCVRGWIAQRRAYRYMHLIKLIQSRFRKQLMRKGFLFQKGAAIKVQSVFRSLICIRAYNCQKIAVIQIQRFIRGQITRRRLLGASSSCQIITSGCGVKMSEQSFSSPELTFLLASVVKLQRWWKAVLMFKSRTKSAVTIQSHTRGWICRKQAYRQEHCIIVIQSCWRGYLARKELRGPLLGLRFRVEKSAANVDDSMRIINRLLSALSELLSMRSVSGILHNCATLNMATGHSQKCCEELVSAGAIGTLLKLIRSVSRSMPDQEVLKHALSTLRNLSRYPHLMDMLIDTNEALETLFWELFRNKDEGYFIASEVLKKICCNPKGAVAVYSKPAILKRLHNLVEELTRKSACEKRNVRGHVVKENAEKRLPVAVELLKLISDR